MAIEYALRTRLLAVPAVTALVGASESPSRIAVLHLAQRAKFPAITLQLISDPPIYSQQGEAGVSDARVQVDCWTTRQNVPSSDPVNEVQALAEAVKAALSAFTGTVGDHTIQSCFLEGRRSLHDDEPGIYRQSLDFVVGYV